MAYPVIICGGELSGKTALCLGLIQKLLEMGLRVGYFKPVGLAGKSVEGRSTDPDAAVVKEALSLEDPLDLITPILLGKRYLEVFCGSEDRPIEKVLEAFRKLSEAKDVVVIEGSSRPETLTCSGCDVPSLSRELNAKAVLVLKGSGDEIAEAAVMYKRFIESGGGQVMGLVANFVPRQLIERVRGVIMPAAQRCGLTSMGIIPDRKELSLPTVADVVQELGAEVLSAKRRLDRLVEGLLVGAMTPESALSWLRRSAGSALITGGDRTDLVLTALEADVSVIVLTGNLYPSIGVLTRSEEKGVPVILVPQDTYTAVKQLEEMTGRITLSSSSIKKVKLTRDMIAEHFDWKAIVDDYVKWKESLRLSHG